MSTYLRISLALLLVVQPGTSFPAETSNEPKGVPIELKIVNLAEEAHELDTRGDLVFQFQESIRRGEKNGQRISPSRVEMAMEIKNTGSTPIQIWVSGDTTLLTLNLEGNGAMTAETKPSPTKEVIAPETITIAAGKSHQIPLNQLAYGFRNQSNYAYITETGIYKLSATFRTGVSPSPKGANPTKQDKFGEVILKSAPLTFRVVRPS